jgi:hypothetical protein
MSTAEAAAVLECDLQKGLAAEEVHERQEKFGPNELR